jgi:GNAT superfamily N-acetyltransferase
MDAVSYSLGGELVTTQVVAKMEETMQAFAVRAACFVGELDVPYSEEFDGHDFGATHLLAYVGKEPVGTLRLRWFRTFGMPERLAVVQRFRGHGLGRLLLEHCYGLAETRGCNVLYSRASPGHVKYLEKQGRRTDRRDSPVGRPRQAVARTRRRRRPDLVAAVQTRDSGRCGGARQPGRAAGCVIEVGCRQRPCRGRIAACPCNLD